MHTSSIRLLVIAERVTIGRTTERLSKCTGNSDDIQQFHGQNDAENIARVFSSPETKAHRGAYSIPMLWPKSVSLSTMFKHFLL